MRALLFLLLATAAPLSAQEWNTPAARELVARGVARRQLVQADSSLRTYRSRAHGFVFFLAQVGQGLTEPPRLVKADELDLEVYWQAPDWSKQRILGWRDGTWLPTDINYHRDHLGIVTNNFGDRIRLGEGDEVRDVIHPLSPAGASRYDFALEDSVLIRGPDRELRVYAVSVRPTDPRQPGVVGTLFLDVATAEVVRFRFSFTPAAYLDRSLEDIAVVLENALFEGRYWLPSRQEVEIRRRTTWLDFPARGIIRGRWEIADYEFNVPVLLEALAGPPIGGLRRPAPEQTTWAEPLEAAVRDVARPLNAQDMASLRSEVERIAGTRALGGLPSRRLAAGAVSDLVRVNRVQGLALGFGAVVRLGGSRVELRPRVGLGTADGRATGGLALRVPLGRAEVGLRAEREVRDLSDVPVIAPVVNSLLSQEGGRDHGDYLQLDRATVGLTIRLTGRSSLGLEAGFEDAASLAVVARPARGVYRPNPALGSAGYRVARVSLERASGGIAVASDLQGRLRLEAGAGPSGYLRATAEGRALAPAGPGQLLLRFYAGAGSERLPAYRSFVLGGRGTLVGEPFRAYGGRSLALGQLEWQLGVPVPAIPLGSYASTGRRLIVAPFVAAGWTERPLAGLPWAATDGIRPVAGVALEWFMRLVRLEAGVGLRDGRIGVTVDIHRDWWGLL